MNEIFTKNTSKKITLPSKWVQNEFQKYLGALVKLCVHGCRKCGTIKPFICHFEISTEDISAPKLLFSLRLKRMQ